VAISTEPDILIIDEALAVGDAGFKTKCFQQLKSLSKNIGLLFITHHVRHVTKLATRVMILEKGKFVYETQDIQRGIDYYTDEILKIENKTYIN
jgi:ABC-type polysaccharide/polyol phosphate transport system ATPase subunit